MVPISHEPGPIIRRPTKSLNLQYKIRYVATRYTSLTLDVHFNFVGLFSCFVPKPSLAISIIVSIHPLP